jgi:hypothetical protein
MPCTCCAGWSDYPGRKPRLPRWRPERPPADATTAELARLYPALVHSLCRRTAAYGDGRDSEVYAWECSVLGRWDNEPALAVTEAQGYVDKLWRQFEPGTRAWFSGAPLLDVHADNDIHGARAQALHHRISIDAQCCRRSWLIHETAHLLNPREQHGARWRDTVIRIWKAEFGIDPSRAIELAAEYGVTVSQSTEKATRGSLLPSA